MDSKNPEISVIVPVYKVEPYLRECIDSILAQTFTDFELILVDDGSPDSCGAICDEYAEKDNRIIVIHQQNQGVSAARNAGMDIMRGEYVAFIDSDDYIAANYFERLYNYLILENAEIAACQWLEDTNGLITEPKIPAMEDCVTVMSGPELTYKVYSFEIPLSVAVWAKLISRQLMEKYRFPLNVLCEDRAIIPYVVYEAKVVAVCVDRLYYYRQRGGSLMHQEFSVKMFDNIEHMNDFLRFLQRNKQWKTARVVKKKKDCDLALYVLKAKLNKVDNIPKKCRMSNFKALRLMRKHCSYNLYSWYLNQIYPFWTKYDAYFHKVEKLIMK